MSVRAGPPAEQEPAESSLGESERRFRELAELLPEIVYEMDAAGRLTFVNKRAFEIFGHNPEHFERGVQAVHLLAPEDQPRAAQNVSRLIMGEEVGLSEYTAIRRDGTRFPVAVRSTPIRRAGRIEGVRGIMLDMTAQRQATEAYRSLIENSIQGLVIFQDSRAVLANQAVSAITGYSSREILAASPEQIMNVVHPLDRELVWQRMQDRLAGKPVPTRYSYRLVRKDGAERWVEINATLVKHAGRPAVQVSYFDVTEARRAEQELRESEERYRELVENAKDAIFVAQDGKMKFHNRITEEMIGYCAEELDRKPFIEMVHPDDRDVVVRNHIKRLSGEEFNGTYSFRVMRKSGHILWAQLNAALITWEGRPAVLCFIRDINEQKRLEEQVRQKQRLESIGTLAGGIAHDFNNMLAAITGFTELALQENGQNTRLRARLEEVLKAGRRARDLINQILTFSRQSDEERRPVRLGDVLEDSLSMIRASLPATIEIRREIDTHSDVVLASPTQLHQVMINLFSNASHAMGGGPGILKVRLSEERLDEKLAESHADLRPGPYLKLTVRDTGHGMDKDVADRVFDPFFTTKRPGEGTGMGLAVVHGIVKSHQGAISVQSERGKGTTFSVLLPKLHKAADADAESARRAVSERARILFVDDQPALASLCEEMLMKPILACDLNQAVLRAVGPWNRAEPAARKRVLVMEDDRQVREMIREVMELEGYQVALASDGKQGIRRFREEPVDLVITDIFMPEADGLQAIRDIRLTRPGTPIIVISGGGKAVGGDFLYQARLLGAHRAFSKPLVLSELVTAVRDLLEDAKHRPRPAS